MHEEWKQSIQRSNYLIIGYSDGFEFLWRMLTHTLPFFLFACFVIPIILCCIYCFFLLQVIVFLCFAAILKVKKKQKIDHYRHISEPKPKTTQKRKSCNTKTNQIRNRKFVQNEIRRNLSEEKKIIFIFCRFFGGSEYRWEVSRDKNRNRYE